MANEKNPQETAGQQPVAAAAAAEAPAMSPRPCPKDCRKCSMTQQICCSSILSFRMYDVMNSVITRLDVQSARIAEIESRMKMMQMPDDLAAPAAFQDDLFPLQ